MIKPVSTFFISASIAVAAIASPVKSNLGGDGMENCAAPIHNPNGFPINLVTGEYDFPFEKFTNVEILPEALVIRGETSVLSSSRFTFDGDYPYITAEWNIAMQRDDNTTSSLDLWTTIGNDATAWSLNLYLQSSKMIFARGNNYGAYSVSLGSKEWADGVFSSRVSVNKSSDTAYNLAEYYVDGLLKYAATKSHWAFNTYGILNPARLLIRVRNNSVMVIRNIRLYSRALTPEEISYNYSIDQMRFGL